jgi:hypothetical protein
MPRRKRLSPPFTERLLPELRDFLGLVYVAIVSRQFLRGSSRRVYFFTDHPRRLAFKFNNILAIQPEHSFLSRKDHGLCSFYVTTPEGLTAFKDRLQVIRDNYVLFTPSSLKVEHTAPVIKNTPLRTYSPIYSFPHEAFKPIHLYLFLVAAWCLAFSIGSFYPRDDLLRHTIAYKWGYDYSVPYGHSTYSPPFDLYILFDAIQGGLHRVLGDIALLFPQLLALSLTFWGTEKLLRPSSANLRLVLLMFTVTVLATRFTLGRPAIVCSSIMLILYAYHDSIRPAVRYLAAALMSPLYYLFFIYLPPLIIRDRKYILSLAAGFAFWHIYSDGQYSHAVWEVVSSLGKQNLAITENNSLVGFYLCYLVFALPMLAHWRKDKKTVLSVLYLSLSNQVRYIESILPLMVSYFKHSALKVPAVVSIGLLLYLFPKLPLKPQNISRYMPGLIPPGSMVLTEDMNTMYQVLFRNPRISISPSYAYGWTEPDVQHTIKGILKGQLDCRDKALQKFDYLIEKSLTVTAPSCIELVAVDQDERLWKITPPQ